MGINDELPQLDRLVTVLMQLPEQSLRILFSQICRQTLQQVNHSIHTLRVQTIFGFFKTHDTGIIGVMVQRSKG